MVESTQWEYRVETIGTALRTPKDEEIQAILNLWGEEGWEVLAFIQLQNSSKYKVIARKPLSRPTHRQRDWPNWP